MNPTATVEEESTMHEIRDGQVVCTAGEGAWCRMGCPDGCDGDGCEHSPEELTDKGKCLAAEWINTDSINTSYGGDLPLTADPAGPVCIEWCRNAGWMWWPASEQIA